ncbi:MAG: universal stress protein, partial [Candidatus Aminicenantes bacterium]|nr:universal stress protein [Candidatus Aminicenantes bacterium]
MTHPIKNVLWATDFSEESKEAMAYAGFFAKTLGAKLTALHVVPDFSPALYDL